MIPWWSLIIAVFAGVAVGVFMAALIVADERDDRL